MRGHEEMRHTSNLRDYFNVVYRRKWIILQAIILVPAIAVFLSMRQDKLYQADAQVLLTQQNLANLLTGVSSSDVFQTVERVTQTQADLARVPRVANRAIENSGITARTGAVLLGESSVTAHPTANILFFSVTDRDRGLAARLATAYAQAYTEYKHELDTEALRTARTDLEARMAEIRSQGGSSSDLYASLADKDELLRTMEALQTSNASVIQPARYAFQVAPKPRRNGILGLALGVILGLGLAFLREALDTRVRSADEIAERLGLPLLSRLPEPSRRLRRADRLVTLDDPDSSQAEAFRMLRTNLDFVRLGKKAEVIMITSAVESEGKSTTAANLAISLARSGKRIALVDLDLRRPYLHRFFPARTQPGLTHVALGYAALEEALITVPVVDARAPRAESLGNGNGAARVEGVLEVLTAGPTPPNFDDFLSSEPLARIMANLRQRADIVIVDATPLLVVGDAMTLASLVDAVVLVTRINVVRRPMLKELHRALETLPAESLGFVLTGAEQEENYGYAGYGYRYRTYTTRKAREPVA